MLINMKIPNKNCQSRGIFLQKHYEGRGTNTNGSHSTLYCSKCYQNGEFINQEIDTPKKMQLLIKSKMEKKGLPAILAQLFTKDIPNLKRWAEGSQKIPVYNA